MPDPQTGNAPALAPAVLLAKKDTIQVISVTSAAVNKVDVGGSGFTPYNKFVSIISDQNVVYFCSESSIDVVNATATSGSSRGDLIPALTRHEGFITGRYIHFIAVSATALVRVYTSSP